MREFIQVIINKRCASVIVGLIMVLMVPVILTNKARADIEVTGLEWLSTTALSENLVSHALVTNGNYVYSIGGANTGENPVSSVHYAAIQPGGQLGAWTATTALPQSLVGHTALVSNDGKIYVIGGWNGNNVSNTIYRAIPNADGTIGQWITQNNSLPEGRSYHASIIRNNHVYVIGGWTGFNPSNIVYHAAIDDQGNIGSWSSTASIPKAIYRHTAVSYNNSTVYVLGGRDALDASRKVYFASIDANGNMSSWTETTDLSQPVYYHTAAVRNNKVYLVGGWVRAAGIALNTVLAAEIQGDGNLGSWDPNSVLPQQICRHASAQASNGAIYVAGGTTDGTDYQNKVYYVAPPPTPTPTNTPTDIATPTPTETPTSCPPPNTPGAVQAVAHSVSEVRVTWEDTNPGSEGCANVDYWVYRDWNSNATPYPTPIATVQEGRNLSYSDSGLSCGTRYMYGVHAYRASDGQLSGGYPPPSTTVTTYICPPSCLQARQISRYEIQLLWKDKSTTESRYEIHRNQTPGATPSPIATLAPNTESYVDNNVTCALTYTYFVYAVKTENDRSERHKSVEMPPCEAEIAVQVTSNITSSTVVSGTVLTYTITYTNSGYENVIGSFLVRNEIPEHARLLTYSTTPSPILYDRTIEWTISGLTYPDGVGQLMCSVVIVTDDISAGFPALVKDTATSEYRDRQQSGWLNRESTILKYINPHQIYMPLIFKSGCE